MLFPKTGIDRFRISAPPEFGFDWFATEDDGPVLLFRAVSCL